MKLFYGILLLLICTSTSIAQFGQIENGGFEDWSNSHLFDTPTDWTSIDEVSFYGVNTIMRSTDAQDGSYSLRLEGALIGTDTLMGYVYHGISGPSGPIAGHPYTENFEAINLQYKCDLPPGDTLFMLFIRYSAGNIVQWNSMPVVYGTYNAWTSGLLYVGNTVQDSLFFGFILGNPNYTSLPSPGAWALIDNIQFLASSVTTTPPVNNSFETWTSAYTEVPFSWHSTNEFLAGIGIENANQTTDAYTGNYAVELTTTLNGNDTLGSALSKGVIDYFAATPIASVPYAGSPTMFNGFYKYSPVNGDQTGIQVQFFEAGNTIGNIWQPLTAQSSFTEFNTPISLTGTPDSVLIVTYSGQNPGSVLILDDLSFSGGNVGLDEFAKMAANIYPNPADEMVMLKSEGVYNYEIMSLSGCSILNGSNLIGITKIDLSNLSGGTYIIRISNRKSTETHKLNIH